MISIALAFASGIIFGGVFEGAAISAVGATLGSLAAFQLSRTLLQDKVEDAIAKQPVARALALAGSMASAWRQAASAPARSLTAPALAQVTRARSHHAALARSSGGRGPSAEHDGEQPSNRLLLRRVETGNALFPVAPHTCHALATCRGGSPTARINGDHSH